MKKMDLGGFKEVSKDFEYANDFVTNPCLQSIVDKLHSLNPAESLDFSFEEFQYVYMHLFAYLRKGIENDISLCGNMLLSQILDTSGYTFLARSTSDIDFNVSSHELFQTQVLHRIDEFCFLLKKLKICTSYDVVDNTRSRRTISLKIRYKNRIIFSADIGISKHTHLDAYSSYVFKDVALMGSSISKIVSDKMCSIGKPLSAPRVKDYYDIYCIVASRLPFDMHTVIDIMLDSFSIDEVKCRLDGIPLSEERLLRQQDAWSRFNLTPIHQGHVLKKPEFEVVYNIILRLFDAGRSDLYARK